MQIQSDENFSTIVTDIHKCINTKLHFITSKNNAMSWIGA